MTPHRSAPAVPHDRQADGGQLLEAEVLLDPGGHVPRHLHLRQDERVEVLEGSLSIQLGGQHLGLTKGESIEVPRRTLHRVSNTHQGHIRFLPVSAPGPPRTPDGDRHESRLRGR